MNIDEIIRMAKAAGWQNTALLQADLPGLTKFAALVAAAEREECAKIALNEPRVWDKNAQDPQHRIAAAILARGQQ